jgi:hypothetical protein
MTTRYDIKSWRKSANDKAYTIRLGSAWTDQKGVLRLAFDALPIPDADGRVQCFLEEPRERDAAPASSPAPARQDYAAARNAPAARQPLEDSIPF